MGRREVGVDNRSSSRDESTSLPLDPSDLRCVEARDREHSATRSLLRGTQHRGSVILGRVVEFVSLIVYLERVVGVGIGVGVGGDVSLTHE